MEYAGYVPGNIIDWGAIGKSLNENYKGVKQAWEARDVEAETLQQAGQKVLDETDKAANDTLNSFVSDSASEIRNQLLQLSKDRDSGKIKHSEFKKKYNNIMTSWGAFSNKLQSMDQTLVEFNKRQQTNEEGKIDGSSLEGFMLNDTMSLRDFTNKKVKLGDDGRVYIYDKNDPNNITDASALLNIENMFDNRLDLTDAVNSKVKPLGKYVQQVALAGGREKRFEDLTQSEDYKKAEIDMIYSIANPNNPRSIASVLVDNSSKQYSYYKTEAQKNNLVAEAISKQELIKPMTDVEKKAFTENFIKNNLIQITSAADGTFQPVITDDHIREAHDIVRNQMRTQLDKIYEESRGFAPSGGGRGGSGSDDEQAADLYPKLRSAWTTGGVNGASTMNALAKGKYTFKWGKDGLIIYKGIANDDPSLASLEPNTQIAVVKKLEDAAPYFYGYTEAKGTGGAIAKFKEERARYMSQNPSGSKPKDKVGELDD
jgi:hypothetical protein